jgi:ATP-dependent RNA helicase DDX54/DBP10
MVKTESGIKLPASYRSGRFDEWKAKNRKGIPRVGEEEAMGSRAMGGGKDGRKWKHSKTEEAKPLDKLRTDYERKSRQLKKKAGDGTPATAPASSHKVAKGKKKLGGRPGGRSSGGRARNELKSADQIRKARQVAERRKLQNARPKRKGKR